jgi:uncharacterized membrane protein
MARIVIPFRVEVNAPRQEVFDYIADLTKHPEWATNPLEIETVSGGPATVGSTYRSSAVFMRKNVAAEQRVVACEPPSRFSFVSKEGNQEYTHEYTFRGDGDKTAVERIITVDVPGARGVFMKGIIGMAAPKINKKSAVLLKSRLER